MTDRDWKLASTSFWTTTALCLLLWVAALLCGCAARSERSTVPPTGNVGRLMGEWDRQEAANGKPPKWTRSQYSQALRTVNQLEYQINSK